MKIASYTTIITVVLWAILSLAQLWIDIMPMAIYWKITITLAVIGGVVVLASLIAREYISEKEMKKEDFID